MPAPVCVRGRLRRADLRLPKIPFAGRESGDNAAQLRDRGGLHDMGGEAGIARAFEVLFHAIATEGDAAQAVGGAQFLHQFHAGAVGQPEIGDDEIERVV